MFLLKKNIFLIILLTNIIFLFPNHVLSKQVFRFPRIILYNQLSTNGSQIEFHFVKESRYNDTYLLKMRVISNKNKSINFHKINSYIEPIKFSLLSSNIFFNTNKILEYKILNTNNLNNDRISIINFIKEDKSVYNGYEPISNKYPAMDLLSSIILTSYKVFKNYKTIEPFNYIESKFEKAHLTNVKNVSIKYASSCKLEYQGKKYMTDIVSILEDKKGKEVKFYIWKNSNGLYYPLKISGLGHNFSNLWAINIIP